MNAAAVFAAAFVFTAADAADSCGRRPPTVTVVGQASEDAKPDVATVSLSIEVEKPTAAEAANENARRAQAVIAGLKAAGVADKDIATVGLSLYPVWNNNQGQRRSISGYHAANAHRGAGAAARQGRSADRRGGAERRRLSGRRLRRRRPRGARGRAAGQGGRERRPSRRTLRARRGDEARAVAVDPRRCGAASLSAAGRGRPACWRSTARRPRRRSSQA